MKHDHPEVGPHASDAQRLERAIAALTNARTAAANGLLFASIEGMAAVEAIERLFQSPDLDAVAQGMWSEAGCPTADQVAAALPRLPGNQGFSVQASEDFGHG